MTKISSNLFVAKRIFPLLWFGFLAFFVVGVVRDGTYREEPMSLVIPCAMAVGGFFAMKKLVWDLADEVYDCGEFLLVRKHGQEEKVPLSNVMNVSVSTNTNPPRITLRLITAQELGPEISFSPAAPFTLNPFAKNQVAEDLISRVHSVKAKSTT